jgi:hypothetical protein
VQASSHCEWDPYHGEGQTIAQPRINDITRAGARLSQIMYRPSTLCYPEKRNSL